MTKDQVVKFVPGVADPRAAFDAFWTTLEETNPDSLPNDPGNRKIVREIAYSAMLTGADWALTMAPRKLEQILQAARFIDDETIVTNE